MHVITGIVLAGLLGKRRRQPLTSMFSSGPVRIVHALPGRIRFRIEPQKLESGRARQLRDKLPTLEGIVAAELDETSGSVLVKYRDGSVTPELLYAAIVRLLGLDDLLRRTPSPVVVKELRRVWDSLNFVVYDKSGGLLDFNSALMILLAAVGTKQLITDGKRAVPHGFTLLWWGAHHLLGQPQD
jgi:hypothetical protein